MFLISSVCVSNNILMDITELRYCFLTNKTENEPGGLGVVVMEQL